jgi:hypothetical protein
MRRLDAPDSAELAGPTKTNIGRDRGASKAIFCAQRSREEPASYRIAI